jgi:hypothetical protein
VEIIKHPINEGSYYSDPNFKDSIFIHHTGGHHRPDWTIDSWGRDRKESTNKIRSGASYVIGGPDPINAKNKKHDGKILEAFNSEHWSHHLFIKNKSNTFLNQKSIAIEICNYGELTKSTDGEFFTKGNIKIPKGQVEILKDPFKGERYFHSYSDHQIESLRYLILLLAKKHDIDLKRGLLKEIGRSEIQMPEGLSVRDQKKWMNKNGITDSKGKKLIENSEEDTRYLQAIDYLNSNPFDLSPQALQGFQGLWSHSNVRADIRDCYPSQQMIQMLRSL